MSSNCKHCLSRRTLLTYGAGSYLGWLLSSKAALADPMPPGRARSAILLWLAGGPSQFETFDPKPGRETGGPTRAVETAIDGVQFAEALSGVASRVGRLNVIRSMSTHEAEHARASYLMHAGYSPNPTVDYPSGGSIIGREAPGETGELPSYICVGNAPVGEGYLSAELAPFNVNNPTEEVPNLQPPGRMSDERVERRRSILRSLEERFAEGRDPNLARTRAEMYESAYRLIDTEEQAAFDLTQESQETRERYGADRFGQGCLLAKRLVERGVRFVEVQHGNWDTHDDNFNRSGALAATLDTGFAALMDDLNSTGLIDETLVVCMGEFGRTPRITENDGRNHFSQAWSAVIGGGPLERGIGLGRTNADGTEVAERPVNAGEFWATIFHAMGVDYTKTLYTPQGRPITLADSQTHIRELLP